jgi:hypothetical protein
MPGKKPASETPHHERKVDQRHEPDFRVLESFGGRRGDLADVVCGDVVNRLGIPWWY